VASDTRAAIYHRVSTVDQNPQAARAELRAAARRLGLRVALHVRETGSGANNQRPGLVRVLQAVLRGEIDTVLVWKLDRFGRSAFDLLGNIRQLEEAGVRFVAVTQGVDIRPSGDPMSRLLLTMLSAVADHAEPAVMEAEISRGLMESSERKRCLFYPPCEENRPVAPARPSGDPGEDGAARRRRAR